MAPKRKRAATLSKEQVSSNAAASDNARPNSRDAVTAAASPKGRKGTATAKLNDTHGKEGAEEEEEEEEDDDDDDEQASMDPPAKRTRASTGSANNTPSKRASTSAAASTDSAKKSKQVSMPIDGAVHGSGEHGEAGTMRMEAPPPAGSVEPVGYHTNAPPRDRPVRVYADGVFDLFHLGHMRQLQQAKTAFPGHDVHLIVGVTGDTETHTRKGLTVMSGKQRAESLRHCRWVDEVIEDCPWIITPAFLAQHAIDFVAHDDLPYGASEGDDIYKPIKQAGQFLVTQRTEGVSTTAIITKIVRDYEQYIARQLQRGTSRQELNVSWLKKNELELKRHVAELREQIRTNWASTGQELSRELRSFWDRSRPSSPAPRSTRSLLNGGSAAGASLASLSSASKRRSKDTPTRGESSTPVSPTDGEASTPTGGSSSSRRGRGGNMDFATGYAMGLIGGVRGWMEGSRRRNLSDSRPQSPEESAENSPVEDEQRERATKRSLRDEMVVDGLHS